MKRGQQWFQRVVRCLIAGTGFYILYRGGGILAENGWLKKDGGREAAIAVMKQVAADLYLPDYQEVLRQDAGKKGLAALWGREVFPVLSELGQELKRSVLDSSESGKETEQTTEQETVGRILLQAQDYSLSEKQKVQQNAVTETGKADAEKENMKKENTEKENIEKKDTGTKDNKLKEEYQENGTEMEKETALRLEADEDKKILDGEEDADREREDAIKAGNTTEGSETDIGKEKGTEAQTEEQTGSSDMEKTADEDGSGQNLNGNRTENKGWMTETETDQSEDQEVLASGLADFNYLLNHYFVVDEDTMADASLLDAKKFLKEDLTIDKDPDVPQILIYHSHSQEMFLDSTEGDLSTGIIGIGDYLTELLEKRYGYRVIHDKGVYDLVDGVLDRSAAYDYARAAVEQILEEYPTIEVVIDLHRDGVEGIHFVTEENGKETAKIMFFNGISRDSSGNENGYLPNPYIEQNLAFSFQLQLAAEKKYPGFTRNIYLKGQRFNLHLRPRSLLIEAGSQLNTIEEEKNAMEPLADILDQVLSGEQ